MSYFLHGLAIFLLTFFCCTWMLHFLAIIHGKLKLHKQTSLKLQETPYPSISIIKPLMGVCPNLSKNLETFFTMKYPVYELLFCLEDKKDPAVKIVEQLIEKYPQISSKLIIGESTVVGVNPKINNMNPAYKSVKYDLILISDSSIKMKENTLLDMYNHMTDNVGLVHQLPFTTDIKGFPGTYEKIFFGTLQSRIYLCADLFGVNCHTGMSSLIRKEIIDKIGGIEKFGCYLAEDYFIAKAIKDNGWKLTINSQPALQNSGDCDITVFQSRLNRWTKLRIAMIPTTILLEPLSECFVIGAMTSWSVNYLFDWDSLAFFIVNILLWCLSDWILLSIVQNGTIPFNKFEYVIGWIFRETTGPYLFLVSLWNPIINWRERNYRLAWGGLAFKRNFKPIDYKISFINFTCD